MFKNLAIFFLSPLQQLLHFVQQQSLQALKQLLHFVQQQSLPELQQPSLHVLKQLLHVMQQQSSLELQQQSQHVVQPEQLRRLQMRLYFFPKMYMNIFSLNLLRLKSTELGCVL